MERKIHLRKNWLIFWGIGGGGAELILRIWGAKKILSGSLGISFWDLGRLMHCFQGLKEHKSPGGLAAVFKCSRESLADDTQTTSLLPHDTIDNRLVPQRYIAI